MRKAAFGFIFITVLLDMLAIGIIAPVLPQLVLGFTGGNTETATQIFGWFGTIFALMQFVAAPVLGGLSDRYGRRRVILASNCGMAIDFAIMALSPTVGWLFLGRMISGVTAASMPTAYAYIADVTPAEKRAGTFAVVNGAFGLGFIVGPAVGGMLGAIDPRLPFWLAAALSALNFLYGLFVLPESLVRDKRTERFSWTRANPVGSLRLLRSHPVLTGLAIVMFTAYLAYESFNTFVLYGNYRYAWDTRAVGITLAIVGAFSVIVQVGVVRRVVAAIGERNGLIAGLLFGMLGFAGFGLAPTGTLFWLAIPLINLWGLATPSAQGLMSPLVTPSQQGQLQGALTSVRGIAMLAGPVLFASTFSAAIGPLRNWNIPGAAFLLAAFILSTGAVLAWHVAPSTRAKDVTAQALLGS
jgi:DHA1 family tetracycline resistance protein-like MFS transporter